MSHDFHRGVNSNSVYCVGFAYRLIPAGFFALLNLRPWWWRLYVSPKRRAVSKLHVVATQKNLFFIVTDVRTSNPVYHISYISSLETPYSPLGLLSATFITRHSIYITKFYNAKLKHWNSKMLGYRIKELSSVYSLHERNLCSKVTNERKVLCFQCVMYILWVLIILSRVMWL
jgi:hypothetical protein